MMILGIGGLENDAACAILRDGELVGALEEDKLRHGPPGQLPDAAIAGKAKQYIQRLTDDQRDPSPAT